ncbi:hypothetical protein HSX10_14760 [Winogradskyella undariae]|uniref:hypothetical protein n=1 Tax=Winogradskyella undariae TaxID=1285465 RepID=UPI00156B6BA7|nr:hypothetical protein [Winogradskyella undariae]NRR92832.1 hypothetical protein [Winogradskyella undariae]
MKKINKRIFKIITSFFLFTVISCATGSIIITGKTRPAITPAEVSLYPNPPEEFETIGIIEASSDIEFSRQATQDRVMNKLKSKAAEVGANGVLLLNTESKESGSTGYFSNGIYFSSTSEKIVGKAKAIFVITE